MGAVDDEARAACKDLAEGLKNTVQGLKTTSAQTLAMGAEVEALRVGCNDLDARFKAIEAGMRAAMPSAMPAPLTDEVAELREVAERLRSQVFDLQRANTEEVERRRDAERHAKALELVLHAYHRPAGEELSFGPLPGTDRLLVTVRDAGGMILAQAELPPVKP